MLKADNYLRKTTFCSLSLTGRSLSRAKTQSLNHTTSRKISGHGQSSQLLPSEKESDVKRGAVQIHKLEEKHLQSKAVLPLRLGAWVL